MDPQLVKKSLALCGTLQDESHTHCPENVRNQITTEMALRPRTDT